MASFNQNKANLKKKSLTEDIYKKGKINKKIPIIIAKPFLVQN